MTTKNRKRAEEIVSEIYIKPTEVVRARRYYHSDILLIEKALDDLEASVWEEAAGMIKVLGHSHVANDVRERAKEIREGKE